MEIKKEKKLKFNMINFYRRNFNIINIIIILMSAFLFTILKNGMGGFVSQFSKIWNGVGYLERYNGWRSETSFWQMLREFFNWESIKLFFFKSFAIFNNIYTILGIMILGYWWIFKKFYLRKQRKILSEEQIEKLESSKFYKFRIKIRRIRAEMFTNLLIFIKIYIIDNLYYILLYSGTFLAGYLLFKGDLLLIFYDIFSIFIAPFRLITTGNGMDVYSHLGYFW